MNKPYVNHKDGNGLNNNDKILEFYSMSLASKWLLESGKTKDKTCLTGIIKCCKHKIPSYLGYVWRYKSEVKSNAK